MSIVILLVPFCHVFKLLFLSFGLFAFRAQPVDQIILYLDVCLVFALIVVLEILERRSAHEIYLF